MIKLSAQFLHSPSFPSLFDFPIEEVKFLRKALTIFTFVKYRGGGIRTHTDQVHWILSPERLPLRHAPKKMQGPILAGRVSHPEVPSVLFISRRYEVRGFDIKTNAEQSFQESNLGLVHYLDKSCHQTKTLHAAAAPPHYSFYLFQIYLKERYIMYLSQRGFSAVFLEYRELTIPQAGLRYCGALLPQ